MRRDDPAGFGMRLAITVPLPDQCLSHRSVDRRLMDVPGSLIGQQRLAGPPGGKIARGLALPLLALPAQLHDLDAAVLLGIADKHDFGAALFHLADYPLHLPGADHAGLIEDQH